MIDQKSIFDVYNKKKGFYLGLLVEKDYKLFKRCIFDHFNTLIKKNVKLKKITINNYLNFVDKINHDKIFTTKNRMLPKKYCDKIIKHSNIFKKFKNLFYEIHLADKKNPMIWRLVRPFPYKDTGPFHKDRWFWDLGHGKMNEKKYSRIKIWISILNFNKKLGLRYIKGFSKNNYRFKSEIRNGILKPSFDEKKIRSPIKSFKGKKGTFIIFHDELLHSGEVLKGNKCRVSLEFTLLVPKTRLRELL